MSHTCNWSQEGRKCTCNLASNSVKEKVMKEKKEITITRALIGRRASSHL